jgi:hypothetical protein
MVAAIQHLQPLELLQQRFAAAASGAGPSSSEGEGEEHCYMCLSPTTGLNGFGGLRWLWWPPTKGNNAGPAPHHRVGSKCKMALSKGSITKANWASKCSQPGGRDCPDKSCC